MPVKVKETDFKYVYPVVPPPIVHSPIDLGVGTVATPGMPYSPIAPVMSPVAPVMSPVAPVVPGANVIHVANSLIPPIVVPINYSLVNLPINPHEYKNFDYVRNRFGV